MLFHPHLFPLVNTASNAIKIFHDFILVENGHSNDCHIQPLHYLFRPVLVRQISESLCMAAAALFRVHFFAEIVDKYLM